VFSCRVFLSPFLAVEEQLNAMQGKAVELRQANDDLAWQTAEAILLRRDADNNARIAAQFLAKNSCRFDALNQAAVTAVRVVAPACRGDSGAASLALGLAWAGAGVPTMIVLS